jgi:WD40 repeat protein
MHDSRWVGFAPDGRMLAAGGSDGSVCVWSVEDGSLCHSLQSSPGVILGGVVSPDNRMLAAAGIDAKVRLWDLASGTCIAVLPGEIHDPTCGSFSPDGHTLAAGEKAGKIHLWDVPTRTKLAAVLGGEPDNNLNTLRFSNSGEGSSFLLDRYIASGSRVLGTLLQQQTARRGLAIQNRRCPDKTEVAIPEN